jgi:photosystem II stability/assembly factor-like uncharacterized protein
MRKLAFGAALIAILAILAIAGAPVLAQQIDPNTYDALRYRYIGPVGNRVIAVAGVPGQPNVYYIGAASGGIFKTTDGGAHWTPIFDGQPVSSVGSLAVAPSDPNIVWAGTGETFIRSNISVGNGIYKSTDAGKTWQHVGLDKTGRIGRIVIDPRNPDVVMACALGHSYGPQPERGVFRTADGGKTWDKVLFVDENTGCSDMAIDPNNPRILFAGMWQLEIHTWGRTSGGPGSGLYSSRDGGVTWKKLTGHGLPNGPMGKIAVSIAPSHSNRVYALIETEDGGLWRSDDGGDDWTLVNQDHNLSQRWHYYTRMAVAPDNPNEVYFLAVQLSVSIDGGVTTQRVRGGGDNHDMWIDPKDGNRQIVGNDGGAMISVNRAETWFRPRLAIAQMYHVAVDNQIPYNVYGNRQDGPSTRGPSNSRTGGAIPIGMWHSVGGCESGFAVPDPVENNIIWSGCYGGQLDRYDEKTQHARSTHVWPDSVMGWPAKDLKYRFQWTFPIAISPHDHNTVYVGSQYVHQTTDGGQSWTVISPDLTGNDKSKQESSGGLTPDNASVEYAPLVFAIAESPKQAGLIWAGTNDGLVQVTRDGGKTWTNVSASMPNLPPWGTISNIEPSRFDAGTAYVSVDFHQTNNRDPFIYRTTDFGKTWKSVSGDIPKSMLSYVHVVREDPVRRGMLYAGTENGIYVSYNDGQNWLSIQNNLPHAPVHWLVIQEHFNDLVVATYGRGFYILDDVTPLRQLTPEVLNANAHLFEPRAAYRFIDVAQPMSGEDPAAGQNPPDGADINYYLNPVRLKPDATGDPVRLKPDSTGASALTGDVKIAILDSAGKTVRTLTGTKRAGINRVWWDLTWEPSKDVRLRTSPEGHEHIKIGAEGSRPLVDWGGRVTPRVAPGTYTVKLSVGGQDFTQKLVVQKDPNAAGSEADVQAQVKMLLEIRDQSSNAADALNQLESMRKQILDLNVMLKDDASKAAVVKAGADLEKKLRDLERAFFDQRLTGGSQDALRWPVRLYAKLSALAGDVSSGDFAPTSQAKEVHALLTKQLNDALGQLDNLLSGDIAGFNKLLRDKNVGPVVVGK